MNNDGLRFVDWTGNKSDLKKLDFGLRLDTSRGLREIIPACVKTLVKLHLFFLGLFRTPKSKSPYGATE